MFNASMKSYSIQKNFLFDLQKNLVIKKEKIEKIKKEYTFKRVMNIDMKRKMLYQELKGFISPRKRVYMVG